MLQTLETSCMNASRLNRVFQFSGVLIEQSLGSLATFLTGVFVARACSPEEYATLTLGLATILIAIGVQRAFITVPYTVTVADSHHAGIQIGPWLRLLLAWSLPIGAGVGVIMTHGLGTVSDGPSAITPGQGFLFVVLFFAYAARDFARSMYLANLQVRETVIAGVAANVGLLVVLASMFEVGALTLNGAIATAAFAACASAAWLLTRSDVHLTVRPGGIRTAAAEAWALGKWNLGTVIAYSGTAPLLPWLILAFLDAGAVATFAVVLALSTAPAPLLRAVGSYLLPLLVHARAGDRHGAAFGDMITSSMRVFAVVYGVWFVVGILYAHDLVTLIYGESYVPPLTLAVLLFARAWVEGVTAPYAQALQAAKRPGAITLSMLVGAGVLFLTSLLLVPWLGLEGAGCAALVSSSVTGFIRRNALRNVRKTILAAA